MADYQRLLLMFFSLACSLATEEKTSKIFEMNVLKNQEEVFLPQSSADATEAIPESIILQKPSCIDTDGISSGLCQNCDHRGACVWQHDNKIFCKHFQ